MQKLCSKCHLWPAENHSWCKTCRKEYDAERWQRVKDLRREQKRAQQRRVKEEINRYKESNPCSDCGNNYHFAVMQFDHLGEKDYVISNLATTGQRNKVWKEIEKCELVCANCHAVRTWERQTGLSVEVAY